MPNESRSDTSPEQTPDASAPNPPAPSETLIQDGFPTLAHDPAAPDPPPGYELLGVVGRGGMGIVYRARDLSLNRDVAIKILHERYPTDGVAAKQFLEEAQITAQLQHPGVPPIHEIGTMPDARPYLVMKLIKGHTLDVMLAVNKNRGQLLAIFEKLCETVGYAHDRGVIHRDLKPSNVMVGAFGEVQVMDWGLAKVIGSAEPGARNEAGELPDTGSYTPQSELRLANSDSTDTLPGSVMGTPSFMSPEQANGDVARIDRRSDVFSLGGVLCVILARRPPYTGGSTNEIHRKAASGEITEAFAALDACGADSELIALTKRFLGAKPDDRPCDAGEVAKAVASMRTATESRARQAELDRVRAEAEREAVARASSSQVTPAVTKWPGSGLSRRAVLFRVPAVAVAASVGVGGYFAFRNHDGKPDEVVTVPPPPPPPVPAVLVPKREVEGDVSCIAVSDDGRWLAVALGDWDPSTKVGGVKLFDRSLGDEPPVWWKWKDTACRGVAFSPDGKSLAVAAGNALRVLNLNDEQEVAFADATFDGFARSVAFSPNWKCLAMGIDRPSAEDRTPRPGFARVWDAATRAKLGDFERQNLPIRCVAFAVDGDITMLAAGMSSRDNALTSVVELWNVASGRHLAQLDVQLAVSGPHVAFARDVLLCAVSSQHQVSFFQPPRPESLKAEFRSDGAGEPTAVALRPDGVVVAFAVGSGVHLGEVKTGVVYESLGKDVKDVSSLAFTRDGNTLISGGHDSIVRERTVPEPT